MSAISADFARHSGDTRPESRQVVGLPAARFVARKIPSQVLGKSADACRYLYVGWGCSVGQDHFETSGIGMGITVEDKQGS
jgi:hypothetical protein